MKKTLLLMTVLVTVFLSLSAVTAFQNGGMVLLNSHQFAWIDPDSQGEVLVTENVYEGCINEAGEFIPHDMTFEYVVDNITYDPIPGITNGFSGFNIVFPAVIPELYSQQAPAVGGPWNMNCCTPGPPTNAEWDAPLPGAGIMPGQSGTFSFCTYERVDVVFEEGENPGWAHTWGWPVPETIIDADGTATSGSGGSGAVEVQIGDSLTSWPTGFGNEGLDWFDTDGNCVWSLGDDLHVEDPVTHPGAVRDGTHDDFLDPIVIDLDNSLNATPGNEQVDVDLESGTTFTGCPGVDPLLKFYDANGDLFWNDGEDIVLDLNNDFVFGVINNIQTFTSLNGAISVPGELMNMAGIACSDGDRVCKKVKYVDEDGDGIIEVGEEVSFLEVIQVHNPSSDDIWTNVAVSDRFGAEIDVLQADPSVGTVTMYTKGKSEKVFLNWDIGTLGPGMTANLVLRTQTDITPGGDQSYTECSYHEYNSGAVLKFKMMVNGKMKKRAFGTGEVTVSVLTIDGQGDCDGDGYIDAQELALGTDPHVSADFPSCGGISMVDICIDADGIATAGHGIPGAVEAIKTDLLASFPVTGLITSGLDWFDNDNDGQWTFGPFGDDLHSEDPATCATAVRDGDHDLGADCKILDLDGSLFDGQQVNCDLEVNVPFTEPHLSNGGCPSAINNIRYNDADSDGSWDNGEDIILDVNGNGIFD